MCTIRSCWPSFGPTAGPTSTDTPPAERIPRCCRRWAPAHPTLALSTRFNREVVERPDQLFEPDAGSLAARIRAILDDRALADELSAYGKRLVAERYRWPDVADRYLAALESARAKRH